MKKRGRVRSLVGIHRGLRDSQGGSPWWILRPVRGLLPLLLLTLLRGCASEELKVSYFLTNATRGEVRIQFWPHGEEGHMEEWRIAQGATLEREVLSSGEIVGSLTPTECCELVNAQGVRIRYCRNGSEPGNLQVPDRWQRGESAPGRLELRMVLTDELFSDAQGGASPRRKE